MKVEAIKIFHLLKIINNNLKSKIQTNHMKMNHTSLKRQSIKLRIVLIKRNLKKTQSTIKEKVIRLHYMK